MNHVRKAWPIAAACIVAGGSFLFAADAPPSPPLTSLRQLNKDIHDLYDLVGQSTVRVTVDQNAVAVLDPALRGDFEAWLKTSEATPEGGNGRGGRGDGGGGRGNRQNRGGNPDGRPPFAQGGGGGFRGGGFGQGPGGGPGNADQVMRFLDSRAKTATDAEQERLRGLSLRVRLNRTGFQGELTALVLNDGYLLLPTGLLREAHVKESLAVTLPDGSASTARFVGTNLYGGYSILQLDKPSRLRPIAWSQSRVTPGDLLVSISANQGTASLVVVSGKPGSSIGDRFMVTADERSGGFLYDSAGQFAGLVMGGGGNWSSDRGAFVAARVRREIDYIIKNNRDIEPLSLGAAFDLLSQHKSREEELKPVLAGRRALYLTKVEKGSLADRAGLKVDDVLVSIDGRPIGTLINSENRPTLELGMLLVDLATRPGNVPVGLIRAGKEAEETVNLPVPSK